MPRFADQEQPPNGQTHPPRQPHVPARARPLSAAPLPASQSYPGRIGRCLYAMTVFLRERLKYCTCRRRQFKPSRLPYLHWKRLPGATWGLALISPRCKGRFRVHGMKGLFFHCCRKIHSEGLVARCGGTFGLTVPNFSARSKLICSVLGVVI